MHLITSFVQRGKKPRLITRQKGIEMHSNPFTATYFALDFARTVGIVGNLGCSKFKVSGKAFEVVIYESWNNHCRLNVDLTAENRSLVLDLSD